MLSRPRGETIAALRQILAHLMEIIVRLAEAVGDRDLKIGRGGEGEKLVHLRRDPQQRRRGADKADLPAGQRKDLAGGADLDGAIAHAGNGDQRNMLAAVEDHMLPDLVADRDGVELLTEPRQQFEVLARIDHGGGIERIVEQHGLGLVVEGASQHLLGEPPMRRFEAQQARNAAGLADDRQIGIVDRLEHDDLVAGLDDGQDGAGQRFGAARRHHHLGHGIEGKTMPAPVMGRDRLPQFRNAHHRGVLVVAVHHRVRRRAADVLGAGIVRKALAEIDGVVVARELRHRLEDRDRKIGEHLVHGRHGAVSRRSWSAIPRPSRPAFRPPDACHRQGPPACAASDAVTDRLPERQANTTCLPSGSGIALGSKLESGTTTAPG